MKVALLLSVKIAELTVFARQCLNFLVVEKETFLIADSTFFCVRPLFGKVRLTTKPAVGGKLTKSLLLQAVQRKQPFIIIYSEHIQFHFLVS